MSLINQALRKAQRDRSPNRMPQPGEQGPAAYANSATNGLRPTLVVGLVIALAVLLGLVAGLSVVLFKGESAAPAQPPATAPLAGTAAPAPAPDTPPSATARVKPEAAPAPGVVEELRRAREATEAEAAAQAEAAAAKAAAEAKAAEVEAARAAAQPSEDIIDWLGRAKLSGVRLSDTESKVILNGQAYAVGEYVNFKLGLKVMIIQESRVLFMDNNGKKYMKRL